MKNELPKKLTWDEGTIGAIDVEGNIYIVAELMVGEDEPFAQEIVKRWNEYEQLQTDNCYKKFYNHIRSELDLAPMRNHDRLDVICKLCGKSFKQITGVAEQALKGGEK